MKILVISYLFPNSQRPNHGIFVLNRIKALSKYVDIKVINPIAWSPIHAKMSRFAWVKEIPLHETIDGIDVYHPRFFSIPKYFKSIESLSYYWSVAPIVKQLKETFPFDLVDLHWTYPDLPSGIKLAQIYQKQLIVTLRGIEAFHQQDSGLRKNIIKNSLLKTDRTISLSHEMAEINKQLIGKNDKTRIIRNGVDTDNFFYLDQQKCREDLNLPSQEKIIVSVGSLIKRKGFDLIIQTLKKLKETHKSIKLYIIGSEGPEGDFRKELKQLIQNEQLTDNIVFVGQVDNNQLRLWYNAADVYCLASRGEGSPNVLTEALACGCPAVATNVGAVKDIMSSEENLGELVESDNVQSIYQGLSTVLSRQYKREESATIFKKYTWDWCAKNVLSVYQELIEDNIKNNKI